jgi:hypothetical protein
MADPAALSPGELAKMLIPLTGPLYIGLLLNWGLMGTVSLQTYIYYTSGFRDRLWIKLFVAWLYLLDLLHTLFATQCMWAILVSNWGNPAILSFPPWTSITFPLLNGVIGMFVQIFFAWRIWTLERSPFARTAAVLTVFIAIAQAVSACVAAIRSLTIDLLDLIQLFPGYAVWLVGSLVADILIMVCMLVILGKAKKNIGFSQTITIVDRLMVQTVHSGMITAVLAAVELILFLALHDGNYYYVCVALILGKIYTNVLISNLNGRKLHGLKDDRGLHSTNTAAVSSVTDSLHMVNMKVTNGIQYTRKVSVDREDRSMSLTPISGHDQPFSRGTVKVPPGYV